MREKTLGWGVALFGFGMIASGACSSGSAGNQASNAIDGGTSTPTQTNEAGVPITSDGSTAGFTFNDFTSAANWESFDLTTVDKASTTYWGGVFDGRYVYFAPGLDPNLRGPVARYDTQADFTDASAWSVFELRSTTINTFGGFVGGAFDGRYVYLVPNDKVSGEQGVLVRYDTHASFSDATAWTSIDLSSEASGDVGFRGAVFDGRYLFLVPNAYALAVRYDTQGNFADFASYESFSLTAVAPLAGGYSGGSFDGRYVYFAPYVEATGTSQVSLATRYDTKADFKTASSWTTFDLTTIDSGLHNFEGSVFDGRYLYFVPDQSSFTVRYDTQADFATKASWTSFDLTPLDKLGERIGGTFDGRYVYYAAEYDGINARFDTQGTFTDATSWSTFDTTSLPSGKISFNGAVFDGRYTYFVPANVGTVVRFDAKTPASLPPQAGASFY